MEAVQFTTYDGLTLHANLYLPAPANNWVPGIIVCPGIGSTKEGHAAFGEQAAAAGFAVLIMDLRGHGESEVQLDGNVFNDVAAGLTFLQGRPEVNPTRISVRGSSMGGWLAIHASAYLVDVYSVVAFCPTNETLLTSMMEEIGMVQRGHPSEVVSALLEKVPRVDVNSMVQLLYRVDVYRSARRLEPRPLLLVHCEGDEVVPAHISQKIYDDAREPKSLWLLLGGDHNFAQHDPATNGRVLGWLKDQLSSQ